jgi:hypothetical protein
MALRVLIVLLILAVPLELPGCGPFLPEAVFHLKIDPEAPREFASGHLGILQPTYERLYQVIAYRWLSGVGLSDAEVQAISPGRLEAARGPGIDEPRNPWLAARNQAPGVQPVKDIDAYRQVKKEGFFDTYLNCNDDAFRTAASTLQRVQGKPFAADWIAAQDMVFADCSTGAAIPQPASDPQLRPDRAYQIASAKFYSEQYDAARQDFQIIAGDASSPWHEIAPYLAARCLIRAGKLDQADMELRHIVADPALARWHASANGLLGYVRLRLHPAERMHELALALMKPNSQASIGQDLIDYRTLFDQNVKPSQDDDLTAWILSFQAGGPGAIEKWRANHALPWLVAALQAAGPKDSAAPEMLAAAAAVKPDSPAYVTANYRRARLLPPDDARALTEKMLAADMPTSARNQFRAERLRLARNFEEFLRYAPRTPVDDDAKPGIDVLDGDSALVLDRAVPLALLKQASTSPLLPESTRKDLQRVVAIRSLVLAQSADFDEVFRLLNTPGDGPFVRGGYGRWTEDPAKIDNFRDNWWCPVTGSTTWRPQPEQQGPAAAVADFLSAPERQQAAAEWQKLAALPAAPDWLGAQTLAFARQHPQDPRVPVALYLVVRSSRYGCTDAQTGEFSKRAFDLLHRSYPDSEWAKKTPYWYQ